MSRLKPDEIRKVKKASEIVGQTLKVLGSHVKAGITTKELDKIAEDFILSFSAKPAFKGYKGFPATICSCINEEIVHGIPSERKVKQGDILSVDVGVEYDGYFGDAAFTFIVEKTDKDTKKLVEVTQQALYKGIAKVKAGNRLYDISSAIQKHVEKNGFSVVRQFVGHGIGNKLHLEPQIPNFGKAGTGPLLREGMVLAIEPMVNMGTWQAEILDNGWTAITADDKPSAHFEHTVLVTAKGYEILTN